MLKRFLFFLASVFLFFFLLDKIPLWSSDEGRFGEIAREMWEAKEWVIPHFNYLPYLDKPVLAPVLTALSYIVFGLTPLATRLVPAVAAVLGICLMCRFTRRLFDSRTADFSSLILLTTAGYVLVGRFAVIDMLMTFLLSMTLLCFMTAYFKQKRKYYLFAYALMGFAFLTKGLIGVVLPFLIFFIFLLWMKNISEIKRMHLLPGIGIVAIIVLPWFLMACRKEPEFFDVFIIKQHFSRFATGTFGRKRPFWFFVPILIATAFPWTLFLPAAITQALKQESVQRKKLQFLFCWIAVIFVFFSIPKSKLPYYLLPVSMPIAILIGDFFAKASLSSLVPTAQKMLQVAWKSLEILSLLAVVGFNCFLILGKKDEMLIALAPLLSVGIFILAAGCIFSYFLFKKEKSAKAVYTLAGSIYGVLLFTIVGMKILSPYQSTESYAKFLKPLLRPGDMAAIYSSPDRFSDFPFYLQRRVTVVGSDRGTIKEQSEELPAEELKKYFLGAEDFTTLFRHPGNRQIFCLLAEDRLDELTRAGLKNYKVLRQDHGKILIQNL